MEAKHTPGEWQVADYIAPEDNSRHLAVWKGEERVICLVSPKEKEDEHDLANAKLIAAAPKILQDRINDRMAFAEILKLMPESDEYDPGDVLMQIEKIARDRMFYAIKKATEL